MCVWTKPGSAAQPFASIVSSVSALIAPPISAMRPSRINTSPRTMEPRLSIVTIVPFRMRIDSVMNEFAARLCELHLGSVKDGDLCGFRVGVKPLRAADNAEEHTWQRIARDSFRHSTESPFDEFGGINCNLFFQNNSVR